MSRQWTDEEYGLLACLSVLGLHSDSLHQLMCTYYASKSIPERTPVAIRQHSGVWRSFAESKGYYSSQKKEYNVGEVRAWIATLVISKTIATTCNRILDTQEELYRMLSLNNLDSTNDADYTASDRTDHYGNYGHEHAPINNLETYNPTVAVTPGFPMPPGLYSTMRSRDGSLYPIDEELYYRNPAGNHYPTQSYPQ